MNILHYFLGFPPYRTGGLTKYTFDLISAQAEKDNCVYALWPGEISLISKKVRIVKRKNIYNIKNYELINPLPVPLDEGIKDIDMYMRPCDEKVYELFLKEINPDVIHIHTLMGLHREFIYVANRLKIKTVFTTHDYFGICPKTTMYCFGHACKDNHGYIDCIQCNTKALSLQKIIILQSPIYRYLKNSSFIKWMRKRHRDKFFFDEKLTDKIISKAEMADAGEKYRELRIYYQEMLERIDLIHFNSNVAKDIYTKYIDVNNNKVLAITHKNIADNRKRNKWRFTGKLRITSLAPARPYKGFDILCNALDTLWDLGKRNFELKIFSPVRKVKPYMIVKKEGFLSNELAEIFADTDILVAPSICYETFGFTVLEALSFGVPVIVSENVGAKDIIGNGGIIVEAENSEALTKVVESLTEKKLLQLRKNIQEGLVIKSWETFLTEHNRLYQN